MPLLHLQARQHSGCPKQIDRTSVYSSLSANPLCHSAARYAYLLAPHLYEELHAFSSEHQEFFQAVCWLGIWFFSSAHLTPCAFCSQAILMASPQAVLWILLLSLNQENQVSLVLFQERQVCLHKLHHRQ